MFVFRNYTVENLFPEATRFSGYGDISFVPEDEMELLWFYQVPVNLDSKRQCEEVDSITQKLSLVASMLDGKTLYVLSLENLFRLDYVDTDRSLENAVDKFNATARTLAEENPNVRFIDFGEYLAGFGNSEWMSWRFYFISQMIMSPAVSSGFHDWLTKRICQIKGQRKKCLVLDLDNTLWGGILGEDGIDGIKIGGDYPGNAFLYFQEALIELSKKGVILTVCSKNNEKDVTEAWEKNPFISLNRDYISAYRINWNNKADNIRELAKELNIGLDSMVFVDDNPTERELVSQTLPMVCVPEFPKKPYDLMTFYQHLVSDYFRIYELTEEDRNKTAQYKANARRAASRQQFTDLTSFIRSLEIEIDIIPADSFNIPRIAQMTQKTNQFNLTTRRYTEADVRNHIKNGCDVFCISVKDKFGDNGITGAIIIENEGDGASIDSLLLSCRILGKNIEDAFVKSVINMLFDRGVRKIKALYIPTAKNSQVANFYERLGFEVESGSEGMKSYVLTLDSRLEIGDNYKINLKD